MTLPDWVPCLVLAPFVGSFLGVLIRRLPRGEPVVLARSRCEICGQALRPVELVPLASYALARGRCRGCGAPIAPFHWHVELAALGVAAWSLLAAGEGVPAARLWSDCVLGWTLLAMAWIDLEHGRLPDVLTLPLVVAGLLATWWLAPWAIGDHAAGVVLGYAAFRLVTLGYRAWRGQEGLGGGDAKLLAAAGAWVGWQGLSFVVVIGAFAGLATAVLRWRPGISLGAGTVVPFGPGLALGTWLVRLYLGG